MTIQSSIPTGWVFYSADFSIQARDASALGGVTLTRDAAGYDRWIAAHRETDEAPYSLYIGGRGMTLELAIADAVANIEKDAQK